MIDLLRQTLQQGVTPLEITTPFSLINFYSKKHFSLKRVHFFSESDFLNIVIVHLYSAHIHYLLKALHKTKKDQLNNIRLA